jgi:hypothetical protein
MPLPIRPVLGILSDNLLQRGSVIPLSKRKKTGWSEGLGIPKGGEVVLYTGLMYQLIPAIDAMASQMAIFEDSAITKLFGLGRLATRSIAGNETRKRPGTAKYRAFASESRGDIRLPL